MGDRIRLRVGQGGRVVAPAFLRTSLAMFFLHFPILLYSLKVFEVLEADSRNTC